VSLEILPFADTDSHVFTVFPFSGVATALY